MSGIYLFQVFFTQKTVLLINIIVLRTVLFHFLGQILNERAPLRSFAQRRDEISPDSFLLAGKENQSTVREMFHTVDPVLWFQYSEQFIRQRIRDSNSLIKVLARKKNYLTERESLVISFLD